VRTRGLHTTREATRLRVWCQGALENKSKRIVRVSLSTPLKPTMKKSEARVTPAPFVRHFTGLPTEDFAQAMKHHLDQRRKRWYRRRFKLWLPMKQEFEDIPEEVDGEDESEQLLPVEELLDKIILKNLRIEATIKCAVFVAFMFLYFVSLIMQRSLADAYALESALKNRLDEARGQMTDVTFSDITKVEEIWDWIQGGLLNTVFPDDKWYNGDVIHDDDVDDAGFIFYYNKEEVFSGKAQGQWKNDRARSTLACILYSTRRLSTAAAATLHEWEFPLPVPDTLLLMCGPTFQPSETSPLLTTELLTPSPLACSTCGKTCVPLMLDATRAPRSPFCSPSVASSWCSTGWPQ